MGLVDLAFLLLAIAEQFLIRRFHPMVYRYGIPLRAAPIAYPSLEEWRSFGPFAEDLSVHVREDRPEVFLCRKYSGLAFGVHLFVARVTYGEVPRVFIRIGWFTTLFLAAALFYAMEPLYRLTVWQIGGGVCIAGFVIYFYRRFIGAYNTSVKTVSNAAVL